MEFLFTEVGEQDDMPLIVDVDSYCIVSRKLSSFDLANSHFRINDWSDEVRPSKNIKMTKSLYLKMYGQRGGRGGAGGYVHRQTPFVEFILGDDGGQDLLLFVLVDRSSFEGNRRAVEARARGLSWRKYLIDVVFKPAALRAAAGAIYVHLLDVWGDRIRVRNIAGGGGGGGGDGDAEDRRRDRMASPRFDRRVFARFCEEVDAETTIKTASGDLPTNAVFYYISRHGMKEAPERQIPLLLARLRDDAVFELVQIHHAATCVGPAGSASFAVLDRLRYFLATVNKNTPHSFNTYKHFMLAKHGHFSVYGGFRRPIEDRLRDVCRRRLPKITYVQGYNLDVAMVKHLKSITNTALVAVLGGRHVESYKPDWRRNDMDDHVACNNVISASWRDHAHMVNYLRRYSTGIAVRLRLEFVAKYADKEHFVAISNDGEHGRSVPRSVMMGFIAAVRTPKNGADTSPN